jgi:glycosyltransferase involved in cell wall biosynthesis
MKVLFFHHATTLGGAPKSLSLLLRGLHDAGVETIVAMPRRPGNDRVHAMFADAGAKVIEERDVRPFHGSTIAPNDRLSDRIYALGGYLPLALTARRLVRRIDPDIVHVNSTCLAAAAQGAHWANPHVPTVAHVREPILTNSWGSLLRLLNRRHVDHFISIDQAGDRSLSAAPEARTIVRNSAPAAYFRISDEDRYAARRELGWSPDEVVLLSLSRLTPANGALDLARSIARIEHRFSKPLSVVFAGFEGGSENSYEAETRRAIAQTTACRALPFQEDVASLLAACDGVIAPFLTDHSSRSVFEGAAAARPSIVSHVGNLTELIVEGETGLSYRVEDEESLYQAIDAFLDSGRRKVMGHHAREFASLNFSEAENLAAVQRVYEKLVERSRVRCSDD